MKILALETSCDETASAIVQDGRTVLSSVVASQIDIHRQFGGVVPEVAAREHLQAVNPCIEQCLSQAGLTLEDIDAFSATLGPGLVGSLLVGANAAKTLSLLTGKPFLGVNHLYGHVASNYLDSDLEPPFLCLLVSGGHSQLLHVKNYDVIEIVGETRDDAVGEAYDKIARVMDIGFPGGPVIDRLAAEGNPRAYALPVAVLDEPYDFSFSGLKTATLRVYEKVIAAAEPDDTAALARIKADVAASFQHAVVKALTTKTLACLESLNLTTLAVAGGVSANRGLRQALQAWFADKPQPYRLYMPRMDYCSDNAAMIGASAFFNPISRNLEDEVFSRSAAVQQVAL